MTHPFLLGTRYPRVLAHRGMTAAAEPGLWENTAAAFAAAHAAGAEYIETDCRVTADGDVVLVHDTSLAELNGDPRPIADMRTAELADLYADHGGLLTLGEALEAFPTMRFNIDAKEDAVIEPLGSELAPHVGRVLVSSFSDARRLRVLDAIRRAGAPERPATSAGQRAIVSLLLRTMLRLSPTPVLRGVDAVQIPVSHRGVRVLTPALIRAAHEHGVEVHVWTVNDPVQMRELVALGVDGLVTDIADDALRVVSPL